ncbi:hypothetical protein E2542_SST15674 [Spatholobus suberectus]|nr:hypothetical protein E2542_SST15674 [Spatholobus suberectus]
MYLHRLPWMECLTALTYNSMKDLICHLPSLIIRHCFFILVCIKGIFQLTARTIQDSYLMGSGKSGNMQAYLHIFRDLYEDNNRCLASTPIPQCYSDTRDQGRWLRKTRRESMDFGQVMQDSRTGPETLKMYLMAMFTMWKKI